MVIKSEDCASSIGECLTPANATERGNSMVLAENQMAVHEAQDKGVNAAASRSKRRLVVVHLLTILPILGYCVPAITSLDFGPLALRLGGIAVLIQFAWITWSWRFVTGQLFHPYLLFMLSAALFHGGQLILYSVGWQDAVFDNTYPDQQVMRGILLVLGGFWALHLGGLLCAQGSGTPPDLDAGQEAATRVVGWAMMLVSAVPLFLEMRNSMGLRSQEGYIALYQQEAQSGLENVRLFLSDFFLPGALFVLAASRRRTLQLSFAAASILCVAVGWFFLGARSTAAMPLIAAAWLFHTRNRRLPRWLLIASAVVMIGVVFPLIGVIRDNPLGQTGGRSVAEAYESLENPFAYSIEEFGSSLRPVIDILALTPTTRPFQYGTGYVHALLNVVPNFISFLHFQIPYGPADVWYTETIDPQFALQGGGWGFSFIAEAYLEGGWIGAPIWLFLIGAFISTYSCWGSRSANTAAGAAVASWWIVLLHFPRGASEGYTRQLLWWCLVPYVITLLLSRLMGKQATARKVTADRDESALASDAEPELALLSGTAEVERLRQRQQR